MPYPPEREEGLETKFIIDHACERASIKIPREGGSESFQVGNDKDCLESGAPGDGMKALCTISIPFPMHYFQQAVLELYPFLINL